MKGRKRKKKGFAIFFVLAIVTFAAVAVLISPLFEIRQIEIVGNNVVRSEEILSNTRLAEGQNILVFSAHSVQSQINQLPFVQSVDVVRQFPDKIVIHISERTPVANIRVAHSATYLLIDNFGMVLESGSVPVPALPVAIGIHFENFAVGEYLIVENDAIFRDMLRLYRLFTRYDFFPDVVDMSDSSDIVFNTEYLIIFFGSMSDMDRKIQYISAIKEQFVPKARGFIEIRDINERPRFGLIR
jgi:cell division protein FtsQ